jgi:polyhydroxyalkanoate synthesis regulator phasin
MDDAELIRRELRAAHEELVRKRSQQSDGPTRMESCLPLMPRRDDEFLRLALMSVAELERHVERLERDLSDLEEGIDQPDEE